MDSYNTVGLTITHLPEISRLIKYVFKMLNEKLYPISDHVVCRKVTKNRVYFLIEIEIN